MIERRKKENSTLYMQNLMYKAGINYIPILVKVNKGCELSQTHNVIAGYVLRRAVLDQLLANT